jgi:putative ABC transport system permease protein
MLRNYLLTAWKVFMRRKLFTAINLLCIVLTLTVLLVAAALLQNTFYPTGVEGKSERFVQIIMAQATLSSKPGSRRTGPLGYQIIDKYLKPLPGVEAVSASAISESTSIYQDSRITNVDVRYTDAEYWKILDFKLLSGRFINGEDVAQGRYVAVLNQSTARKLFPGLPWLGQKFSIGTQQMTVIGVVEDAVQMNAYADIWVPLTAQPSSDYQTKQWGNFTVMVLAHSVADVPAVKQAILRAARSVQLEDPKKFDTMRFWGDSKLAVFSRTLLESEDEDGAAPRLVAIIIGLMLLFMALPALNLINLNVGRIMERSGEIGVRRAFGATTRQLVLQLVLENVLLCLAGGVCGLLCAAGVIWWLEGSGLIPYLHVDINLPVFGYSLLITLVFGVLSGLIPALKMSRLDPVQALKGNA